jgi:mannose-1-phosphate guanylyltransferase
MYVEKPRAARAEELRRQGALWHAGVFATRASVVRDSLHLGASKNPATLRALETRDYVAYSESLGTISIERGLLERCDRLAVVPGEFGWDDVGTWASLRRARELDDDGNGVSGEAYFQDSSGNVVHAEGGAVVLFGVRGLLVVSLPGLTFVTTLDRAAELKTLVDSLPQRLRGGSPPTAV